MRTVLKVISGLSDPLGTEVPVKITDVLGMAIGTTILDINLTAFSF
jgi:hypothetical protein